MSWGLGWGLQRTARGTAFWHWGENNGEFQNFAIGHAGGEGVVVLTNSGNGLSIMPGIVATIFPGEHPAFAWMGYERYDSPARVLLRDIRARGSEAALATQIVNTLIESAMNRIGYALLETGRVSDAVLVFERNVQRFPASANVYDSVGEAYAAAGARAKAVGAYERALELDPTNTNAVQMLAKLRAR